MLISYTSAVQHDKKRSYRFGVVVAGPRVDRLKLDEDAFYWLVKSTASEKAMPDLYFWQGLQDYREQMYRALKGNVAIDTSKDESGW